MNAAEQHDHIRYLSDRIDVLETSLARVLALSHADWLSRSMQPKDLLERIAAIAKEALGKK